MTKTKDKPIATHQQCPDCGHDGCLTVWENRTFCNSMCGFKWLADNDNVEHKEETSLVTKELKEVSLPYRKIPQSVVDFYGIKTGVDDEGEAVYRKYPYPQGPKYRYLPKDFSKNAGFRANKLFGMDKFNAGTSKHITIVEGEDDAPSAYFMLGEKFPVVALPSAGVSEALLKECYKYLNSFQEIIICTDGDHAGDVAANKILNTFPGKVSRVSMTTHKDPNEFLTTGNQKDFLFAWHNRKKYVPEGVYNTAQQFKDILSEDEMNVYLPTPCQSLNDTIKGLMQGHLTVLTGPEGQGKTEIMRWFEWDILKNHPEIPIAVLHMEESKKVCLTSYACYELGINLRDPDNTVPQADVDQAIEKLTATENLYLFDFGVEDNPLDILEKVRYFATVCGCKYIFIDPIQQLAYGKDKNDTEEKTLSQISVQLERLATELGVGIVMTTHVNDDGQTRSSRMIGKSASVRIDLTRDHMNPDDTVRNTTKLAVSKNRPTSKTGYGGSVVFDSETFTLRDLE